MHSASPNEQERFYLYLVLLHAKGARGWTELKAKAGTPDPTWRQVAEAMGLVDADDEYERALIEAAALQSPSRLRTFFAHLVLQCELRDPEALWEKFAEEMSEGHKVFIYDSLTSVARLWLSPDLSRVIMIFSEPAALRGPCAKRLHLPLPALAHPGPVPNGRIRATQTKIPRSPTFPGP